MKKINLLYVLPAAVFMFSCEPEFKDEVVFQPGEADFRNYFAIGNSLTSGFQSNALSREGQINSYPAILAQQFAVVEEGMTGFKQPLIPGDRGAGVEASFFANNLLLPALKLGYNTVSCSAAVSLSPVLDGSPYSASEFKQSIAADGPYNNVGVPGAKVGHIDLSGYASANPYYGRFAASSGETILEAALKANPTFYSLWIGNNDVLSYATSGGEGDVITSENDFRNSLEAIITELSVGNNAEGVIANIPDITSLPYFNTIPWNALEITGEQAGMMNAHFADYNNGLQQAQTVGLITAEEAEMRRLKFSAGKNGFLINDNDLTNLTVLGLPNYRQLKSNELLILKIDQEALQCEGFGSVDMRDPNNPSPNPITDEFILDATEIENINNAVEAYNNHIEALANQYGLALVDANSLLNEFESGLAYDGITYTTKFVTGGLFSLDGVHPNSRGYAIIANAHIDAINEKFNANVPKVNVNDYAGEVFP